MYCWHKLFTVGEHSKLFQEIESHVFEKELPNNNFSFLGGKPPKKCEKFCEKNKDLCNVIDCPDKPHPGSICYKCEKCNNCERVTTGKFTHFSIPCSDLIIYQKRFVHFSKHIIIF